MNRTERAARVKRDLAKLKPIFPECNEMVYSICSRPAETGATWTKLARETMGRRDTHKLTHSLRVRVTEERWNEVKAIIEADGRFPTVNAWLDWWVWVYIRNHKESRSPVDQTGKRQEGGNEADSTSDNITNIQGGQE